MIYLFNSHDALVIFVIHKLQLKWITLMELVSLCTLVSNMYVI